MEENDAEKEIEEMYSKMLENFSMEGTELERTYLRTLENFPEIRRGDIQIKYLISIDYALMLVVDPYKFVYENEVVVDPMIIIGDKFLESDEQEKEAMLAHELGHYDYYTKNLNPYRFSRLVKWTDKSELYDKYQIFFDIAGFFSKRINHKVKRIQKWYLLTEVYANRKAAEAGYGKHMISAMKKIL